MNGRGPSLATQRFLFWSALRCAVTALALSSAYASFAQSTPEPAAGSAFSSAAAITAPAAAPASTTASPLHFQISAPKTTYHVGELIVVTLTYSSDATDAFRIHSPKIALHNGTFLEHVTFVPSEAAEPIPEPKQQAFDRRSGDVIGEATPALGAKPQQAALLLNDRANLHKPGQFEITVESDRVFVDFGLPQGSDAPSFRLRSNSIAITIVPATPEWQAQELADIRKILDTTPVNPEDRGTESPHARAIRRLSLLDTDDATRELVRRFAAGNGGEGIFYIAALMATPHAEAARAELNRIIADPNFGVTNELAQMTSTLALSGRGGAARSAVSASMNESLRGFERHLIDLLSAKQGAAFTTTFATIERLRRDSPGGNDPQDLKPFVARLIEEFPHLSLIDQQQWLAGNWEDVKDSAWIPTLRTAVFALPPDNSSTEDDVSQRTLRDFAMAAWVDIDPAGARQTILSELENPESQLDMYALSRLPDQALPEAQQHQIARLFVAATDPDAQEKFAEVIRRYGDATMWNDISTKVTQSLRLYPCQTTAILIQFATKHAPDDVDPLLDNAMAPPENGAEDCRADVFNYMSASPPRASMEKFAIADLNDANPVVVQNAATYLRDRGSAAAEQPLWRRYEAWSAATTDPSETQPQLTVEFMQQITVGRALVDALISGRGWIADKAKLEQARDLGPPQFGPEFVSSWALSEWEHPPLVVHCADLGGATRYEIAQYTFDSFDELSAKLGQFPNGSSLAWDSAQCSANGDAAAKFTELQSTMSLSGVSFKPAAAPQPDPNAEDTAETDTTGPSDGITADRVVLVY